MAIPFSQTLRALEDDNHSIYISLTVISLLLALGWAYWFVSTELVTYQTSQQVQVSNKERLVTRFSDTGNGVKRPQMYRERKVMATFPASAAQTIQKQQPAFVRFQDEKGHSTAIPAEVIEIIVVPNNRNQVNVVLNAQFDANISPNPFATKQMQDVQIETHRITPIESSFHASGINTQTPPLTVSPHSSQ